MSRQLDKEKSPLASAKDRYPEVDLNDLIISNDVLVDVLIMAV